VCATHRGRRLVHAFGRRAAQGGVWLDKTVAGIRMTKLRGLAKVDWAFTFAAAYNLVRAPKLTGAA
jgi:hypothetical protein